MIAYKQYVEVKSHPSHAPTDKQTKQPLCVPVRLEGMEASEENREVNGARLFTRKRKQERKSNSSSPPLPSRQTGNAVSSLHLSELSPVPSATRSSQRSTFDKYTSWATPFAEKEQEMFRSTQALRNMGEERGDSHLSTLNVRESCENRNGKRLAVYFDIIIWTYGLKWRWLIHKHTKFSKVKWTPCRVSVLDTT